MNSCKIIPGKSRYLNGITLLFLVIGVASCSKHSDQPVNNNEVNATITLSSGATVNILAKANNAVMGDGAFGSGTFISCTNETKAYISISAYGTTPGTYKITSPGTYYCMSSYTPKLDDPNAPAYSSLAVTDANRLKSSVTFTTVSDTYIQGHFSVICWYGQDSVIINGTFKGDHLAK